MRIVGRTLNLLTLALLLVCFQHAAFAQSSDTAISISSSWEGLGEPLSSHMTIVQRNGRFYAGSRRVPDEAVRSLLAAIEMAASQEEKLGVSGLQINSEWLTRNAAAALKDLLPKWEYNGSSLAQRQLFLSSFGNYEFVRDQLAEYEDDVSQGRRFRLDNEPDVRIEVTEVGERTYVLRSLGNEEFLGKWLVMGANEKRTTSVAVSRSLWELLPPKFTNRESLSERALRYMIADIVMMKVRDQWEALGVRARLGGAIDRIVSRFALERSAIAILLSIDIAGGESWNAVASTPILPPNVKIGFSLPIRNKKLVGAESFLGRIDGYVDTALSSVWLRQFLLDHPEAKLKVRFVEDRSLSRKAEQQFVEDMTRLGRTDLAQRVAASVSAAVFVELDWSQPDVGIVDFRNRNWSRWIILPGGDSVLWEYAGEKVGNWTGRDFRSSDCYGWKCVGATISGHGEILN